MDQEPHFPTHPNPNLQGRPNGDLRYGRGNPANQAFTYPNPQGFHGAEHLGPYLPALESQSGYFDQVRYGGEPCVSQGSLSQKGMGTSPVRLDQLLMGLDTTPPSLSHFQDYPDASTSSSSQARFTHVAPNGGPSLGGSSQVLNSTTSHAPNGAQGSFALDNNGQPYYGTPNGASQAHFSQGVPNGASQAHFSQGVPNGASQAHFSHGVPNGASQAHLSHVSPNGFSSNSQGPYGPNGSLVPFGSFDNAQYPQEAPHGDSRFSTNVAQGINMPHQGAFASLAHQRPHGHVSSQGMAFGENFDHRSGLQIHPSVLAMRPNFQGMPMAPPPQWEVHPNRSGHHKYGGSHPPYHVGGPNGPNTVPLVDNAPPSHANRDNRGEHCAVVQHFGDNGSFFQVNRENRGGQSFGDFSHGNRDNRGSHPSFGPNGALSQPIRDNRDGQVSQLPAFSPYGNNFPSQNLLYSQGLGGENTPMGSSHHMMNDSQQTLEIFSTPLPKIGTPQRFAIQDVEYSRSFGPLALPPCSPQRAMVLHTPSNEGQLNPFASYLKEGDYEMQDALVTQGHFDESRLAQFPTFQHVAEFFQERLHPIHANFAAIFEFMHLSKATLEGILQTSAHNDKKVLERTDVLWQSLEEVLITSKDNFTNCSNDVGQIRECFNKLVEIHLPREFHHLRESLKEAFAQAESRFTTLESVVGEHTQKFRECSTFCNKLQKDVENLQKSAGEPSQGANLFFQANLTEISQNIRDVHQKCQENSANILRLKENSLGQESGFVSRSEFDDLQKRLSHMEHIVEDLQCFKEDIGAIMNGMEQRINMRSDSLQGNFDRIVNQFGTLESELQRCKSLLDLKAQEPPPQLLADSTLPQDFTIWSQDMHKKLCDVIHHLEQVDKLTIAHENKFKVLNFDPNGFKTAVLHDVKNVIAGTNFPAEIGRLHHLEHRLHTIMQQLGDYEEHGHHIALLRDSLNALRKEFSATISGLAQRFALEFNNLRRIPAPETNPFDGFGPKGGQPQIAAPPTILQRDSSRPTNVDPLFARQNSLGHPPAAPQPGPSGPSQNAAHSSQNAGPMVPFGENPTNLRQPGVQLPQNTQLKPTAVYPVGGGDIRYNPGPNGPGYGPGQPGPKSMGGASAPIPQPANSGFGMENVSPFQVQRSLNYSEQNANAFHPIHPAGGATAPPAAPNNFATSTAGDQNWPPRGSVFHPLGPESFSEGPPGPASGSFANGPLRRPENSPYSQRDMTAMTEISRKVRPKWDGEPSTWKDFWKNWEYYWNLRKDTLEDNQEMKKWLFVECLPHDEGERARHLIIEDKMSFDTMVQRYHQNNVNFVPRYQAEANWKSCVPGDKSFRSVDFWYSKWKRLATEVPELTETQKKEQFDMVLSNIAHKTVKEYKKEELLGKSYSLEERWQMIVNELSAHQLMNQISNVYKNQQPKKADGSNINAMNTTPVSGKSTDRSRSPRDKSALICFNCQEPGHVKAECPHPPKLDRPPSRNSSRDSNRSFGSRDSNRSRNSNPRRSFSGDGRPTGSRNRDSSGQRNRDFSGQRNRDFSDQRNSGGSRNRDYSDRRTPDGGRNRDYYQRSPGGSRSQDYPSQRPPDRRSFDTQSFKPENNSQGGYYDKPKGDFSQSSRPPYRGPDQSGRNSPHRGFGRNSYGYKSSGGSNDSMEETHEETDTSQSRTNRSRKPGIPSRSQLLSRQRSNQCLTCGDSSHSTGSCPQSHRGRSPTVRRMPRDDRPSRPKVEFQEKISRIDDRPPTSVREGDVRPPTSVREGDVSEFDEQIVDAYMAARSIAGYASASDFE